ncbi:MAG TPA: AmmeMemoRadiSam system protein B [Aggregatilineaceae bacterium]|nr:AmmeMemoRadiSam system protein B [Aggregatilineaceae bacterium]
MGVQQPVRDVRPSAIAGKWYPANPQQLAESVDAFIRAADISPINGQIIGILAPHAGHRYSGPVAGYAYKLLQGLKFDVVALVGPSHYPYPASCITTAHQAYETPLGTVPVDHDLIEALQKELPIEAVRRDPEHSLEIELPFLQRMLGDFRLLPLALVDQSLEMTEQWGQALGALLAGKNALLVASSDLSHFYSQANAHELDKAMLDAVAAFDPAEVIRTEEKSKGFACGRGAIAAVMVAARELGANSAQIVGYATSGDVTHDYSQVVGYGAAVFYRG